MPLLEDELNLAIKNGVTSITDRFKWLTNYKNFIVTGLVNIFCKINCSRFTFICLSILFFLEKLKILI